MLQPSPRESTRFVFPRWGIWLWAGLIFVACVSLFGLYVSSTVEQVDLSQLSATPGIDIVGVAQVEELRRSNDRLVNTVWGVLSLVFGVAVLFTGASFLQSGRAAQSELNAIRETTTVIVDRKVDRIELAAERSTIRLKTLEEALDALVGQVGELTRVLEREREDRLRREFQVRQWIHNLDVVMHQEQRMEGPFPTALVVTNFTAEQLELALDIGDPRLMREVVDVLRTEFTDESISYARVNRLSLQILRLIEQLPSEFDSDVTKIRDGIENAWLSYETEQNQRDADDLEPPAEDAHSSLNVDNDVE